MKSKVLQAFGKTSKNNTLKFYLKFNFNNFQENE